MPTIRQAKRIDGHRLHFVDVDRSAAEFIVSLRTDSRRSQHINPTSTDVACQIAYIDHYRKSDGVAYFVVRDHADTPIGTMRIYDARGDSFSWGSWVLVPGAPHWAAIESLLIMFTYAVDVLGFARAHFTHDIGNERVWRFMEGFGAWRTGCNDKEYFYAIDAASIRGSLARYRRYLPDGIAVED